MKKFRLLFALALVVTMISTAAFAFDFQFDGENVSYTDTGVTVKVVAVDSVTTNAESAASLVLSYDANVWKISGTVDAPGATNKYTNTAGKVQILWEAEVTLAGNIATVNFVAKDDTVTKEAMLASKFSISSSEIWDSTWENVYNTTAAEVGVAEAATAEDISVAVEDAAYTAVKGATDTYTGVWVGSIEKELEGKTMTAAKLVFGDNVKTKDLAVDSAIGGNGSVAFKIAVLGVPRVEGTMTPAYDAAVVLTVE